MEHIIRRLAVAIAIGSMFACSPNEREAISGPAAVLPVNCGKLPPPIEPQLIVKEARNTGPFTSHLNKTWLPGTELIEVRWLPVFDLGGLHQTLIYTTSKGDQHVIAGFPDDDFDLLLRTGTLVLQVSRFEPTERFREDLSARSLRQVIARGGDLSGAWQVMKTLAAIIDRLGIDYFVAGPNSNSAASTILKYADAPQPDVRQLGNVGSDFDLFAFAQEKGLGCADANDEVHQVLQ